MCPRPARKKCLCAIMKKGLRSPRGLSCRFLPFAPFHIHPSVRPSVRPSVHVQHHKGKRGRRGSGKRSARERSTKREELRDSFVKRRTSFAFKIINSPSPLFSLSLSPSIHPSGGIAKFPRGEIFSTIAVHRPNGQREGGGEEVDWASRGEGRGVRCPDNSVMAWG